MILISKKYFMKYYSKQAVSIHVLKGCALNILNPTILNSEFSLNYVNI